MVVGAGEVGVLPDGESVSLAVALDADEHAMATAQIELRRPDAQTTVADVKWDGRADLRDLQSEPTKMRVGMKDARVHASRFAP